MVGRRKELFMNLHRIPGAIRFSMLVLSVFCVLTSWSYADLTFTGNATYDTGTVPNLDIPPQIAGGAGANNLADTSMQVNIGANNVKVASGGFKVTGGSFSYTSGAADVGKTLVIDWLGSRPFDNTAGNYIDRTTLKGSVTLPKGWTITGFAVTTDWAGEGVRTDATVDLGAFAGGNFNKTAASGVFNVAAGSDNLSQNGTISFTVGAANETLVVDWPNSADSLTASVPEPCSMVVFGLGLLALYGAHKRGLLVSRHPAG
jgi:hypothetical protein